MSAVSLPRVVKIEESVLGKNQETANGNRRLFRESGVLAVNMMSSPGSGKTALLEALLSRVAGRLPAAVIAGDCATDNDARRLSGRGAEIVQVMTGGYCHLDAEMISRALANIDLAQTRLLFIENVGNLVCPAGFDLGEELKVGVLSVTEGEDKPLKYPSLFARVDAVIINKIDIAQAAGWDRDTALEALRTAAPGATLFEVSARTGAGLDALLTWLEAHLPASAGVES
jgi:hydrogenase nickel incorporation protein HypB